MNSLHHPMCFRHASLLQTSFIGGTRVRISILDWDPPWFWKISLVEQGSRRGRTQVLSKQTKRILVNRRAIPRVMKS